MANTYLSNAVEKSTYVVVATFTNESGVAIAVKTITWTLTDSSGNIVNSRENVAGTPGSTVNIVLSGNDLNITTYGKSRVLTINATYDSDYGTDLPLKSAATFRITDLLMVS